LVSKRHVQEVASAFLYNGCSAIMPGLLIKYSYFQQQSLDKNGDYLHVSTIAMNTKEM
jgi:hypothetical protein